jgi:hemerythrin
MDYIKWSPQYSMGAGNIDTQHQELIMAVNKLYTAVSGNKEPSCLLEIFEQISHYASIHFADEEKLMQDTAYPFFEEHSKLHKKFRHELQRIKESGICAASMLEMLSFTKSWIKNHLLMEDMKLARHLQKRN